MAMRFRRSVKIAPGVRLNVGKKSASVRVGGKGFGVTTGTSGTRVSAGVPGTGLYATQKVGSPKRSAPSRSTAQAGAPSVTHMTVQDAVRAATPKESGFDFPSWWLVCALLAALATIQSRGGSLLIALPCGYVAWHRLQSAKYKAMSVIKSAQRSPSAERDTAVKDAVSTAPESWTVQREAGLYFRERGLHAEAAATLGEATRLFPGDRRLYAVLTAGSAIEAGHADYFIQLLEPYLASANPDGDDVDAVVVSMLAQAIHKHGDPARALEVVNRLPLRRRNLDQPLLLGLCVRAMAKHALGKKADAKRDLDRVYAADPGFALVPEVQATLSE